MKRPKIRVNNHGNVDIRRRVPKLVRHFGKADYKNIRIRTVCDFVGSPYADALVGFEKVGGRSYPRFDGVVAPRQYECLIWGEIHRRQYLAAKRAATAKKSPMSA